MVNVESFVFNLTSRDLDTRFAMINVFNDHVEKLWIRAQNDINTWNARQPDSMSRTDWRVELFDIRWFQKHMALFNTNGWVVFAQRVIY